MIHDKYTIRSLDDICYHLKKYRRVREDWRGDFYNEFDALLLTFENDEETLERMKNDDELYAMVTEWMDVALMMGKEY